MIPDTPNKLICQGILGSIRLVSGYYLVVLTSKLSVGTLLNHEIYRVGHVQLMPYTRNEQTLTETENRSNEFAKKMIQSVLQTEYFYFSYTYDLTQSLQQLNNTNPDYANSPLYNRADPKYVWNKFMLQTLDKRQEFSQYMLPLMHGVVATSSVRVGDKLVEFGLISRRSALNAGTRFNVRGTDEEGNPANFVETEQIVIHSDFRCSYVQLRGSIPIFWTQKTNLKYKPPIKIDNTRNHASH